MPYELCSRSGCSTVLETWCAKLLSRGDGKAGRIHELVDFVDEYKLGLHVCNAWSVRDSLHKWIILELNAVDRSFKFFVAIHRFSEGDSWAMYSSLESAEESKPLRQAVSPRLSIFFTSTAKRLLMLDYILPGLSYFTKATYSFGFDNCQHFAAKIQDLILSAGLYLEICVKWKPECEFALEQKQKHRPEHRPLSVWQHIEYCCWLDMYREQTSSGSLPKEPDLTSTDYSLVKRHKELSRLVFEVVDRDYKDNLERTKWFAKHMQLKPSAFSLASAVTL